MVLSKNWLDRHVESLPAVSDVPTIWPSSLAPPNAASLLPPSVGSGRITPFFHTNPRNSYCCPAQGMSFVQPKLTPQFSPFGSTRSSWALPEINPVLLGRATKPMLPFGPPRVPRSV